METKKTSAASVYSSKDILRNGIVLKQCPVTCGRPTRMTEAGFARACAAQRKRSESFSFQGTKEIARVEEKTTWCDVCQGEQRPAELAIIPLAEIVTLTTKRTQPPEQVPAATDNQTNEEGSVMPSKRVVSKCESCGNKKSLSNCSGNLVCSNCAPLYGAINRRPDVVLKAIRHLRPNLLSELGEQLVPVQLESEALKLIAEAVGYEGTSGDELVELIRAKSLAATEGERAIDVVNRSASVLREHDDIDDYVTLPARIKGIVSDYNALLMESRAYGEPSSSLIRALDCSPSDWQMAAIQTAALSDDAQRDKVINYAAERANAASLVAIAAALGLVIEPGAKPETAILNAIGAASQALDQYSERIEALVNERQALEDRNADLEHVEVLNEQIFARLRELIDGNGLSNAELPSALEVVIGKSSIAAMCSIPATLTATAASPIDSHLLDLVLDFPGIPLERIAMIREAV